jgi:sugar lactone lactonase YvrE
MRRLALIAFAAALVTSWAPPAAGADESPPHRIPLPRGFAPEGIVIRHGNNFYVGSITTGAIYRAHARTGEGAVFVPGKEGRSAIGLSIAHQKLFVAGGATGRARVYDARSGELEAAYRLATGPTFVNDVVATEGAAWFTDSVNQVLYRVPLTEDGTPGDPATVETVPLSGDIAFREGFNVNGIDATHDGETLIIVQSNTGWLFNVDADSGETERIDLDGARVRNGDGILLQGRKLFVVQNMNNRVAVVKLDSDLASGEVLQRFGDPSFDVPTTIASSDGWLYVVNARFGTPVTPQTRYWVTVLKEPKS